MQIYKKRIQKRKNIERGQNLIDMIYAANAPNMKDGGQEIIDNILQEREDEKEEVTPESRKRELEIARRMLRR